MEFILPVSLHFEDVSTEVRTGWLTVHLGTPTAPCLWSPVHARANSVRTPMPPGPAAIAVSPVSFAVLIFYLREEHVCSRQPLHPCSWRLPKITTSPFPQVCQCTAMLLSSPGKWTPSGGGPVPGLLFMFWLNYLTASSSVSVLQSQRNRGFSVFSSHSPLELSGMSYIFVHSESQIWHVQNELCCLFLKPALLFFHGVRDGYSFLGDSLYIMLGHSDRSFGSNSSSLSLSVPPNNTQITYPP